MVYKYNPQLQYTITVYKYSLQSLFTNTTHKWSLQNYILQIRSKSAVCKITVYKYNPQVKSAKLQFTSTIYKHSEPWFFLPLTCRSILAATPCGTVSGTSQVKRKPASQSTPSSPTRGRAVSCTCMTPQQFAHLHRYQQQQQQQQQQQYTAGPGKGTNHSASSSCSW
jgi:hypothetical protein